MIAFSFLIESLHSSQRYLMRYWSPVALLFYRMSKICSRMIFQENIETRNDIPMKKKKTNISQSSTLSNRNLPCIMMKNRPKLLLSTRDSWHRWEPKMQHPKWHFIIKSHKFTSCTVFFVVDVEHARDIVGRDEKLKLLKLLHATRRWNAS